MPTILYISLIVIDDRVETLLTLLCAYVSGVLSKTVLFPIASQRSPSVGYLLL